MKKIIAGDLAHLSGTYPNTGASKGEINDEEWIKLRPKICSSLSGDYKIQPIRKTSKAFGRLDTELIKEVKP